MIETSSFIVLLYCKLLSVVLDCKIIYEHTISAKIGLGKKGFLLVTACAYYLTVVGVGGGGRHLDAVYFGGTSVLMKKTLSSSPETSKHS